MNRPGRVLAAVLRAPGRLYDWRLGPLLGDRFLRLGHVGRVSGRLHHTVLEVVDRDPDTGEVVVMAGFGRAAQWYRNLEAHPTAEIEIGRTRFRATSRTLTEEEGAAALVRYERRHRLLAPVVRRVLSRLVGWRYDGSDAARRRLVAQLPMVGFLRRPPRGPDQD